MVAEAVREYGIQGRPEIYYFYFFWKRRGYEVKKSADLNISADLFCIDFSQFLIVTNVFFLDSERFH